MRMSESISEITSGLATAQAEIGGGVRKDAKNPHFRSDYATLESVTTTVVPALAKQGIALIQDGEATELGLRVSTTLLHKSGEWIAGTIEVPVSKADAQGYGSALTYGRRYGLMTLLGLAPEDDDGNAATAAPPAKAQGGRKPNSRRKANGSKGASAGNGKSTANTGGQSVEHILARVAKADKEGLVKADEWARNNIQDETALSRVLDAVEARYMELDEHQDVGAIEDIH